MKKSKQFYLMELDYSDAITKNYENLKHLDGFVLLASADKTQGRYDIVSACPYDRIEIEADASIEAIHEGIQRLEKAVSEYEGFDDALIFQGGAIGFASYDLAVRLQGIEDSHQLSLGNQPLLCFGLYDWAIITDHHLKKVYLFSALTKPHTKDLLGVVEALWLQAVKETSFELTSDFKPLTMPRDYYDSVLDIQSSLISGRCYQVNYTQAFQTDFSGDPWCFYKQISQKNPVPFSAYIALSEYPILSFSPERFLKYEQGRLLASPIKGTIKRGIGFEEEHKLKETLYHCPKNRAENIMIVDLMRNDLGKISKTGSVKVKSLYEIQSFEGVHHLVSHIESDCLDSINPVQAFFSCFPGGSITGTPKHESMKVIAEKERYKRGLYCGSIGYFSRHGRFDFNIAIRSVCTYENHLYLYAGGGIVIDSEPDSEYLECISKISAIVND